MNTEKKIILEGIVGSHAYGLATPESDIDIKGIFIYPTEKILSLDKGKNTINSQDPDKEYHEVEKFIRLASKCNPTILELLYLTDYELLTLEGRLLVDNRKCFLSKVIYKTYGGYALSQAKKLYKKGMKFTRYEKHARHCFRLLLQGKQLLQEHTLSVKVNEKERLFLFKLSKREPNELLDLFEKTFKEFDKIETTLPDKPDYKVLNQILLTIRRSNVTI